MEMPFGGTVAADTFETGTRAAAWGGTTTIVDFAIQSMGSSLREGLDAWHAKAEGNCAIDYALPHDHGRRQRGLAQGDGGPGRRGRHQLQAVHGLPRRALQRRRPGAARAAEGRRDRRADPDARRERHRHRRAGRAGAGPRRTPTRATTASCGTRCWRPRPPTGRSSWPRWPARPIYIVHLSATEALAEVAKARDEGLQRLRRDLPAVPVPVLRRPGPARLRGRQVRVLDAAAAGRAPGRAVARAAHRRPVGGVHRPLPVLLQGAEGDGASATSPRSPTGCRAWSTGWTCCTPGVLDGHISRRRWIEIACATPARMFGLYPRKGTIAPGSDADVVLYDPTADADAVGGDAPHGRRLLLLRGQGDHRPGATRCCPAAE